MTQYSEGFRLKNYRCYHQQYEVIMCIGGDHSKVVTTSTKGSTSTRQCYRRRHSSLGIKSSENHCLQIYLILNNSFLERIIMSQSFRCPKIFKFAPLLQNVSSLSLIAYPFSCKRPNARYPAHCLKSMLVLQICYFYYKQNSEICFC